MRLFKVLLIAACHLTVVPLAGILVNNSVMASAPQAQLAPAPHAPSHVTVVYKTN